LNFLSLSLSHSLSLSLQGDGGGAVDGGGVGFDGNELEVFEVVHNEDGEKSITEGELTDLEESGELDELGKSS
jgi:hypothetical protein